MKIRIIKFDQLDEFFTPYRLFTLGLKRNYSRLDGYEVIDKRLFLLAVVKYDIVYGEIDVDA